MSDRQNLTSTAPSPWAVGIARDLRSVAAKFDAAKRHADAVEQRIFDGPARDRAALLRILGRSKVCAGLSPTAFLERRQRLYAEGVNDLMQADEWEGASLLP